MKLNKITKAGIGIACGAVGLAVFICIISLAAYGKVYFFNGYEITAFAWIMVILGFVGGCITIVVGCLLNLNNYSKEVCVSSANTLKNAREAAKANDAIYFFEGVRGRMLTVYDDKVIITTRPTIGSFITGNSLDGEKTIYFVDCIGVQFKQAGMTLGYIQFETASSSMNNKGSNMFNENSFTWDTSVVSNDKMQEVANFVKGKIDELKRSTSHVQATVALSCADELKKFKELLDSGIITQEEFDAKKKQLLGL